MKESLNVTIYSAREELLNVLSHGAGLLLSIIGFYFLLQKALRLEVDGFVSSSIIFGASLILLYAASTLYHSARNLRMRLRFKILDHIAIFILIAGSYTPFALVTLRDSTGSLLLWLVWGIAGAGTILKLFYTGKFKILSTLLYVIMGWVVVFAYQPMVENLSTEGLSWLAAGGISYTLGAIIYSMKVIKYNHAIFHFFVLLGSYCHFISIYKYVIS